MKKLIQQLQKIVGEEIIDELYLMAKTLKDKKIVHVNSTRHGGGVAELLKVLVSLTNALEIKCQWEVIQGPPEFFECTKAFHNNLQGHPVNIPRHWLDLYEKTNEENAAKLKPILNEADVVFIHDPQPAALIKFFPKRKNKWIWRCHIDLSQPQPKVWNYLHNFVKSFDASIFSLSDFVQPLPHPIFIIPPSIDPLNDKNIPLDSDEINSIFKQFHIDPKRPMIVQVSRFDRFKDPIGVIQSYRLVKKFKRDVQLALVGGGAHDDPEARDFFKEVQEAAKGDPDIYVIWAPPIPRFINAFQRAATIVLQKSIKEGFGLTVTEALWKGKPVIGGNTGGIRLQVINHQTGFLVNTPEGAALRLRYLLQNPKMIEEMGSKGSNFVRENFLSTRELRDQFTLVLALFNPNKSRIELK